MRSEWEALVVSKDPAGPGTSDWCPLHVVRHGAHLRSAVRIAEDERIVGGIVNNGRLILSRTKVVFTTPKRWSDGNRYGSFEFEINWIEMIENRNLYWIESLSENQVVIFRFLVSRKDVSTLPVLSYDPASDKGPVQLINGEWYWAQEYAAEFLFDEDISLCEIKTLAFVKHDDTRCSQRPGGTCPEAGIVNSWLAHSALMGLILGRRMSSLDKILVQNGTFLSGALGALSWMRFHLGCEAHRSGPINNDQQSAMLLRSAFLMLHAGDADGAKCVLDLIDTKSRVEHLLWQAIVDHFGVLPWDLPK